jgi:hypothetical protein
VQTERLVQLQETIDAMQRILLVGAVMAAEKNPHAVALGQLGGARRKGSRRRGAELARQQEKEAGHGKVRVTTRCQTLRLWEARWPKCKDAWYLKTFRHAGSVRQNLTRWAAETLSRLIPKPRRKRPPNSCGRRSGRALRLCEAVRRAQVAAAAGPRRRRS